MSRVFLIELPFSLFSLSSTRCTHIFHYLHALSKYVPLDKPFPAKANAAVAIADAVVNSHLSLYYWRRLTVVIGMRSVQLRFQWTTRPWRQSRRMVRPYSGMPKHG